MPVKRWGVNTGVPSAIVVKAAQYGAMSQNIEPELAAIEAEVGELEELMMMEEEEQHQDEGGVEQAAQPVDEASPAEEPSTSQPPTAAAASAASMPADQEETVEEAAPEEPTAEETATEEVATEEASAPAPASSGCGKKAAMGLKRKGFAAPRAAAASAKVEPAATAPAKMVAPLAKKLMKGRPVPPAEAVDAPEEKENAVKQLQPAAAEPKPAAKPVAAKPKPLTKPKPAADAAAEGSEAGAAKPKRSLNPYMQYVKASRVQVKADHPDLDAKQLTSKLGELFRGLRAEEKKPFEEAAAADKQRYDAEVAALGLQPKQATKAKVSHIKSAYQLFMNVKLPAIKSEHPKAGMPEISRLVSAAWKELSNTEKEPFNKKSKELKAAAKEVAAAVGAEGEEVAAAAKPAAKKRKPADRADPSRKRSKKAAAKTAEEKEDKAAVEEEAMENAVPGGGEEEQGDDEMERMNCDWEAHPAECILAETTRGHYLVMRKGLGFVQYGLVDAAVAKAQRLGVAPGAAPCPVSLELVEEYENYKKAFKSELHDNTDAHGELVLDDLAPGSVLESCLFLGQLREPTYPLHRPKKGDPWMRVPMMGTCAMVQRMLMVERAHCKQLLEANQALQEELQAQQAGNSGVAVGKADMPGTCVNETAEA